jgi:branched-chain amino acid transport system substrate-binding protein
MTNSRKLIPIAFVLAALACKAKEASPKGEAAAAAPSTSESAAGIFLGHVTSLTGEQATFGDSTDKGVNLAVAEVNAAGGINGKLITVKTYDDQGKPEEAALAATRLIVQDKVHVLLGEVASSRSLAIAPIADAKGIPQITSASTNPRVTKDGEKTRPYVFRVCFIDPFQGTVMAKFAHGTLKAKKVAILRDVGNDYSVGLADFFTAKFKELGGTIVSDQSYKAGDQDFKAQLTAIKTKAPELIYVPGYYTDVALVGRQARELGIKVPLAGGDGWDSAKLYEIAEGALDGSYFSNHYTHENPAPLIQDFVRKYKEKYGATPDALAALGYDAARVAMDSISRSKDLTGPSIREAIEATKGFSGVTGTITLDADHNPVKSAVVLGIEKNAAKYVTTVEP